MSTSLKPKQPHEPIRWINHVFALFAKITVQQPSCLYTFFRSHCRCRSTASRTVTMRPLNVLTFPVNNNLLSFEFQHRAADRPTDQQWVSKKCTPGFFVVVDSTLLLPRLSLRTSFWRRWRWLSRSVMQRKTTSLSVLRRQRRFHTGV